MWLLILIVILNCCVVCRAKTNDGPKSRQQIVLENTGRKGYPSNCRRSTGTGDGLLTDLVRCLRVPEWLKGVGGAAAD